MKIAICAPTFRRPDGLRRLLTALGSLEFADPQPRIEVIVVDNDPDRSGGEVCERLRDAFRWELRYEVEARRGVVHGRNRALELVSPDSDWIAFIDDDEVPHAFTNNVLIRASILAEPRLQPAFAERYALTGGEDRHFFERVRKAGFELRWANAAIVALPFACLRGPVERLRACQNVASDLGRLWHSFGGRYEEYRERQR